MRGVAAVVVAAWLCAQPSAQAPNPLLNPALHETAPAEFLATVNASVGTFVIRVKREWAPHGADRFYTLAKHGFYNDARFFRVIPKFMAQVGIPADPAIAAVWKDATLPSDRSFLANTRGRVTFAQGTMASSRTTQFFINYGNNSRLDIDGFAPFGEVITSMVLVERIHDGYGEGPDQSLIVANGTPWLMQHFPRMSYIKTITIGS
jgi:peptidyl-prolyl cis-trans isomerase A (cyclophilin A)